MKITAILIFAFLMQVSAAGLAQKVTLNERNASLESVIDKIRSQTGYEFMFNVKDVDNAKKVNINVKGRELSEVLDLVFEGQDLSFSVKDKFIVLKPKEASLFDRFSDAVKSVFANVDARGKILDETGKPLEGATVVLKGTERTAKTDAKGEFVIPNVPDDGVLVIRYVGYKTLEINLKDATLPLQIKLNVQTGELQEVNVKYSTGYQDIPKERATGSFVQIDNETLNRAVGTNILDRLLNVTNSLKFERQGTAGATGSSNISIRGFSTINANKRPLIVLDGFVYDEDRGASDAQNLLRNINPNDIESVTILRDAAAASIWGARSGNGVIVINTKKGKYNQDTQVNFNTNVNLIEKPRLDRMTLVKPIDAIEFEKTRFATGMYNDYDDLYPLLDYFIDPLSPAIEALLAARKRNSGIPNYNALEDPAVLAELTEMGSHDVRDDVSKYLLQTGVNQQYALNLSGGTDKMKFYGSVGYDRNVPNIVGNTDSRLTLRFDNTYRPLKDLELNTYLVYTSSKNVNNGLAVNDFVGTTSQSVPYSKLSDESGNPLHVFRTGLYRTAYVDTASYPGLLDWHYRPLDELKNNDNKTNRYSARFGGSLKYTLIPGLAIELNSQYEKENNTTRIYASLDSYGTRDNINRYMYRDASGKLNYPFPLGGVLNFVDGEKTSWNVRGKLMLNKAWNRHQVSAIAGVETSESRYEYNQGSKYGYDPVTGTSVANLNYDVQYTMRGFFGITGTIPKIESSGGTLNRFLSYLTNGAYTFDNKYTFTGSARVDASNFLGAKANQRFTPIWSAGLSWDIGREQFLKVSWLNSLKFRATYGYNANLNNKGTALPTGRYSTINTYHNEVYVSLQTPPNPGLTWEKVRNINFALDYSILNGRLNGFLEYYNKKGIDLIGNIIADATTGVPQYAGNYASMKGKGLDFKLNSLNLSGRFKWRSDFNLSYNTDEVTDYQQILTSANFYISSPASVVLRKPLLKYYSYPSAGLDPTNGNPRGYVNGEIKSFQEVIQNAKPEDLIYHGSATPTLFGNLINTFSYQNFSLSLNMSFRFNYYVKKSSINYNAMLSKWGNVHADYYLRWQNPGDENFTSVPSLPVVYDFRDDFYGNLESLIVKGDHIRLNDLRLSYSLNKSSTKQLPFSNANIYLYASNLGILWRINKQGIDPDFPDSTLPPASRTIALGLNLNF